MNSFHFRIKVLGVGMLLLFGALIARLWELQVIQHQQWDDMSRQKLQVEGLETPPREAIIDSQGIVLAQDRPSFDLSVVVSRLELTEVVVDDIREHLALKGDERRAVRAEAISRLAADEALIQKIARIAQRPAVDVARAVYKALGRVARGWERASAAQTIVYDLPQTLWLRLKRRQEPLASTTLASATFASTTLLRLSSAARRRRLAALEQHKPLPGVRCTTGRRRVYPHGELAAHVLGYLREYTREDLISLRRAHRLVRHEQARQAYWDRRWDRLSRHEQRRLAAFLGLGLQEADRPGVKFHVAEIIGALRETSRTLLGDDDVAYVAKTIGDDRGWLPRWMASADLVTLGEGERLWLRGGRYLQDMNVGATGLEALYNQRLRGKPGYKLRMRLVTGMDTDRRGLAYAQTYTHAEARTRARGSEFQFLKATRPRPGSPLTLTLDLRIQRAAAAALRRYGSLGSGLQRGAAILMDLRNDNEGASGHRPGDILALVSLPSFDPNLFTLPRQAGAAALLQDPTRPLINRAIGEQYPLGSVIKPLLALIALEAGVASPRREVVCQGAFRLTPRSRRSWKCEHADGPIAVTAALTRSCNVYFYTMARELGIERLGSWLRRAGFGQRSGIDLPGESAGVMPTPEWKADVFGRRAQRFRHAAQEKKKEALAMREQDPRKAAALRAEASRLKRRAQLWQWETRWLPGDTINLGIGQGSLAVTPLQALRVMQLIASGGRIYRPRLVSGPRVSAGEPLQTLHLRPEHLRVVRDGMVGATTDPHGTAYLAFHKTGDDGSRPFYREFPDIRVAAKTGSAQTGRRDKSGRELPTHAWFAGFAPADDPEVAFIVVLEEAGYGGSAAAPVAVEMLRAYFRGRGLKTLAAGPRAD